MSNEIIEYEEGGLATPEELGDEPFDPRYFINETNKDKVIKYFESEVRDSFEYKWLIDTFKTVLNVKECVFFKGYSLENGMKLEFHHHPFTMYDYTEAVVNKQLKKNGGWVYEHEVEKEVARIHYQLKIGLVPLDPTSHGLVHDGKLDIHPDLVIGDYDIFFEEYEEFIPMGTKLKYQDYLEQYHDTDKIEYPEILSYNPQKIRPMNEKLITSEQIDQLLLPGDLNKIDNKFISEYIKKMEKK
jgi:hypothetical protein